MYSLLIAHMIFNVNKLYAYILASDCLIILHTKGIKLHVVMIFVWNKMPTSFWFALINLNENVDEKVGESAFVARILSCFC